METSPFFGELILENIFKGGGRSRVPQITVFFIPKLEKSLDYLQFWGFYETQHAGHPARLSKWGGGRGIKLTQNSWKLYLNSLKVHLVGVLQPEKVLDDINF